MEPPRHKPEEGVTAFIDPNAADPGAEDSTIAHTGIPEEGAVPDDARPGPSVSPAIPNGENPRPVHPSHHIPAVSGEPAASVETLARRHWYVSEDRLVGVDVTEATVSASASAVPFTVDGSDLFHYEDANKVRLELTGVSTAAALARAMAFLSERYPSLRPAASNEIPPEPCVLHSERLLVRFREWIAAATAE